jgi:hypothetical protein
MSKKFPLFYIVPALVLVMSFAAFIALAWTEPAGAPPGNNVPAPLNVSNQGQSKSGGLILNTGGALTGLIVNKGNVGIGTLNPQSPAPNNQGSNIDVNDIYLRSISKWASQLGGGTVPAGTLTGNCTSWLNGGAGIANTDCESHTTDNGGNVEPAFCNTTTHGCDCRSGWAPKEMGSQVFATWSGYQFWTCSKI